MLNQKSFHFALRVFVRNGKNKSRILSLTTKWIYNNQWFGVDKEKTRIAVWIVDRLKIQMGITVNSHNFWKSFDHLIKIAAINNLKPTIH